MTDQHYTAAIKTLENLGYTYHGGELWKPPLGKRPEWLDATTPAATVTDEVMLKAKRYDWLREVGGQSWHDVTNPKKPIRATGAMYDAAVDDAIASGKEA